MNTATKTAYYEAGHITLLYLCGYDLACVTNTKGGQQERPFDDYFRSCAKGEEPHKHHELIPSKIVEEEEHLSLAGLGGPAAEQLATGRHTRHIPMRVRNKADLDDLAFGWSSRSGVKYFDSLWETARSVLAVPEVWDCVRELVETFEQSPDGRTREEVILSILQRRLPFERS